MSTARQRITAFWDNQVAPWLNGDDPMPHPLPEWFASYAGKGRGEVTRDGFVEPYQGNLNGNPRMVSLGLNPGLYIPELQRRDGSFADEIRRAGAYSRWTAMQPYMGPTWLANHKPNQYFTTRVTFGSAWFGEQLGAEGLLVFELFPWPSTAVTGAMRPSPTIVNEFVGTRSANSKRSGSSRSARSGASSRLALNLPLVAALGKGVEPYGSAVASRAIRVHTLPSGQLLLIH
ncbi:MAG: hypothetical protein QOF92_2868 [Pseudonocardiales bacterium]|jgi:hypothetical protein|nr:hypothetical protein [Pseudonocardiales bacterium]